MRCVLTIGVLLVLASGYQVGSGRLLKRSGRLSRVRLLRATARPDLAGDLASVAQLKLASRKTKYRVGETISADLAIINITDHPVFFCKPRETLVAFKAVDAVGKEVPLWPYKEVDLVAMRESYRAVGPEELIYASFRILAGRDDNAFRMAQDRWNLEHSKEAHHLRA